MQKVRARGKLIRRYHPEYQNMTIFPVAGKEEFAEIELEPVGEEELERAPKNQLGLFVVCKGDKTWYRLSNYPIALLPVEEPEKKAAGAIPEKFGAGEDVLVVDIARKINLIIDALYELKKRIP